MSYWPVRALAATVLVAGSVMGVAAGAASAKQAVVTSAAGATIARPAAKQGGSCNGFSGAYQLPGSNGVVPAAYSDASVVVPACGPIPGSGGGPWVYAYPGSLATPGYQCVEFSERYLYYKYGATMGIPTNGDQVVAHYAAKYPSLFSVVANGTAGKAPVQGDVLSFSTVPGFDSSSGGHTGVVQGSSVNSSGNGSITLVEENAASSGVQVLTVSNWTVSYPGFSYIEWLHTASAPSGSGVAAVVVYHGYISVFTVSTDGSLQETYLPKIGKPWHSQNLSTLYGAPHAAAGTSPAALLQAGYLSVFTVNASDHKLQQTYLPAIGQGWVTQELPSPVIAAGTSPAALMYDKYATVFTANTDGTLENTYLITIGQAWHTQNLSTLAGAPHVAAGTSPAALLQAGYLSVFTVRADNAGLQQTYLPAIGQPWHTQQLPTPPTS